MLSLLVYCFNQISYWLVFDSERVSNVVNFNDVNLCGISLRMGSYKDGVSRIFNYFY